MVSSAAKIAAEQLRISAIEKASAKDAVAKDVFEKCSKYATEKVESMKANSMLFCDDSLATIPTFSLDELVLGKVLGKGGFGTVNEIRGFKCSGPAVHEKDDCDSEDQMFQDKKFIADHCIRDGGDARYAIKALSSDIKVDEQLLTQGTIDMAVETMFLSVVSHPHIITMRAFATNGMIQPNYFIVLDRLYDTLEARIPKWRLQEKRSKSVVNKLRGKSRDKLGELLEIKLSYAYDLMGAIEYLHKKRLVYRDLKPENVGFNVRDDIVLFDFGLVREIDDKVKLTDKTWKLTGETGSLRYMAPEVAANKPYGYSADIYSFGIMLWEMLKTEKPFAGFNKKLHFDLVVQRGSRPKVDDSWGPSLKGLINSLWHQDLTKRPEAARASMVLKREAAKAMGGEEIELNNFRRKSTFVNRDSLREKHSLKKSHTVPMDSVRDQ
ncbi:hypothetical protein ACHAXS_010154 [Conticribra weissflogii]